MSPPDRDTVELIHEIKQGLNVEANFHWLFERHYPQILRFFRRKGFYPEECRDLTQETFVSVYKGLKDLRQAEQFENWLFAIAHNVWCSEIESRTAQKRSATLLSLEDEGESEERLPLVARLADRSADPLTLTMEKEKLERLREALQHLPQQMRPLYAIAGSSRPVVCGDRCFDEHFGEYSQSSPASGTASIARAVEL